MPRNNTTTKTKKQKLGPLQSKWLKALRSGRYKQARGKLFDKPSTRHKMGFCCLGVACKVVKKDLGLHIVDIKYEDGDPKFVVILAKDIKKEKPPFEEMGLPDVVVKKMKFRSEVGTFKEDFSVDNKRNLTGLNDDLEWSFKRIADFVEKNPELVFTGPA